MSLINREEAVYTLGVRANESSGLGKVYLERAMQIIAAMPEAIVEEKKEVAEAKWTSVDTKPRKKGAYLCLMIVGDKKWHEVGMYEGKGNWSDLMGNSTTQEVAYWMALPSTDEL